MICARQFLRISNWLVFSWSPRLAEKVGAGKGGRVWGARLIIPLDLHHQAWGQAEIGQGFTRLLAASVMHHEHSLNVEDSLCSFFLLTGAVLGYGSRRYTNSLFGSIPACTSFTNQRGGMVLRNTMRHISVESRMEQQQEVIIAIGGNIGNRVQNFRKALELMRLAGLRISDHACLYESAPAYVTDQPLFLNSAVRVYTRLHPEELLVVLKNIEKDVGRVSGGIRFGPRPIDLDIIFYGNSTLSTESLQIPHCRFSERPFVLAPVVDLLGPDLDVPGHWSTHPSTKGGIFGLWQKMGGESQVGKDGLTRVMPVRDKLMDWWQKTHVMGILNVTPDSFSDGGKYTCVNEAVSRARAMALQGADIIDVGAQSTRPKATRLSTEEELGRLLPVLEEVKKVPELEGVLISVDTFDATVAEAAVGLGADIINDVSGGYLDSQMYKTAATLGVPYILMHMRGDPQTMQSRANLTYDDNVCKDISEQLSARLKDAQAAGIPAWSIITDPGIGFAKNQWQDLEILRNLGTFRRELSRATLAFSHAPIVIGPSRKKFLGHITGHQKAEDRDAATIGAVSVGVMNGANIVRVHNVAAVRDAIKVVDAIFDSAKPALETGEGEAHVA